MIYLYVWNYVGKTHCKVLQFLWNARVILPNHVSDKGCWSRGSWEIAAFCQYWEVRIVDIHILLLFLEEMEFLSLQLCVLKLCENWSETTLIKCWFDSFFPELSEYPVHTCASSCFPSTHLKHFNLCSEKSTSYSLLFCNFVLVHTRRTLFHSQGRWDYLHIEAATAPVLSI